MTYFWLLYITEKYIYLICEIKKISVWNSDIKKQANNVFNKYMPKNICKCIVYYHKIHFTPPPPSHSTVVGKEEWVFINTILTYGWTGNRTLAALVRSSTTELPKPISTVHVPPTTKFSSSPIPNNNLYKLTKVPYNIRNKA